MINGLESRNSMGFGDGEKYISFLTDFDGISPRICMLMLTMTAIDYLSQIPCPFHVEQVVLTTKRKCVEFNFIPNVLMEAVF